MPERKVASTRDRTHNHQVMSPTWSPLSHPDGAHVFENTVGKVKIDHNKQFLLFPQFFIPILENCLPFSSNSKVSSANPFSLEEFKICRLGKG